MSQGRKDVELLEDLDCLGDLWDDPIAQAARRGCLDEDDPYVYEVPGRIPDDIDVFTMMERGAFC